MGAASVSVGASNGCTSSSWRGAVKSLAPGTRCGSGRMACGAATPAGSSGAAVAGASAAARPCAARPGIRPLAPRTRRGRSSGVGVDGRPSSGMRTPPRAPTTAPTCTTTAQHSVPRRASDTHHYGQVRSCRWSALRAAGGPPLALRPPARRCTPRSGAGSFRSPGEQPGRSSVVARWSGASRPRSARHPDR